MKELKISLEPMTPEREEEIRRMAQEMAEKMRKKYEEEFGKYDPDKDPVIKRLNEKLDKIELEYYRELFRQKRCWFWWW
jgi:hypothetical protein